MEEYKITEEELAENGLQLSEYALDTTYIPVIINIGYRLTMTRIKTLNDNIKENADILEAITNNNKVEDFKNLQYRVIYNLIFNGEADIYDKYVDDMISFDLGLTAINGFQKRIWGTMK